MQWWRRGALDERGVLWSEAKPGVQVPTLSVRGHATLWVPTCYADLGTKDGSRMDMLASEVGTVCILEGRGGFGCRA